METSPLAQSVDAFLRHLVEDKRSAPNTVAAYQNDLAQFQKFVVDHAQGTGAIGGADSSELVRPEVISSFLFALRERRYSPATIARRIAAVKSFFAFARAAGFVAKDPTDGVGSPRVPRSPRKDASASDVQALIDGCDGSAPETLRNRAMLTLLYQTGLRVSEVVTLDVADVSLTTATLTVRGRRSKVRQVPLPTEARAAVEDYLAQGRPTLLRNGSDPALFLNGRGGRLTRQGFWLVITTRARRSGVASVISPHTLRNAFARRRLESGTALIDLKELLGHVSISTTRAYARGGTVPSASPLKA